MNTERRFVLTQGAYADMEVVGVFSTPELAQKAGGVPAKRWTEHYYDGKRYWHAGSRVGADCRNIEEFWTDEQPRETSGVKS